MLLCLLSFFCRFRQIVFGFHRIYELTNIDIYKSLNLSCCYFLESLLTVCIWEQAFNIWTDSFEVQFARSPVRYYMDEFRLWTQYAATWTEKKWNEENYDLADLPIVSAKIFLITYHSSWWTFFEPKFLCLIKFMVKMTFQTRKFFK